MMVHARPFDNIAFCLNGRWTNLDSTKTTHAKNAYRYIIFASSLIFYFLENCETLEHTLNINPKLFEDNDI